MKTRFFITVLFFSCASLAVAGGGESHGGGDSAPECFDVGPPHDAGADGTEPQRQHVLATLGILQHLWARKLQVVGARSSQVTTV